MQFIEDGLDIPDELITARDKGEVIFICGAGISIPAGLPSFNNLVKKIYEELGEEKEGREKDTFEEKKYDQTLWLLEKRLTGGSNRIRNAVNEILDKQIDYFDLHQALLILSQNSNQKSCLITTNFDTCFEQIDNSAQSYSAPNLPIFPPDHGIIHIHGKLREELILTFADIADAYLQSGWAKQFLNRLARWKRIIFVGYSGNDPFFQLLMAAVSEDRQWAQDIPLAYAFVEKGTEDLWQAFDIKTISYTQGKHTLIQKILIEWSQYAENPKKWREEKLINILHQSHSGLDDLKKSQFKFLTAQRKVIPEDTNPSPAWWEEIKNSQLNLHSVIPWIIQNLEHPEMVKAFVAHPPEDMNFISSLGKEIGKEEKLQEPFRQAWKLILYAAKNRPSHKFEQLEQGSIFKGRIKNNDYGQEVREGIVNAISPRLKVGVSWKSLEEEIEGKQKEKSQTITLYDLMRPEFETSHFIHAKDILEIWQPENTMSTFQLCRDLTHSMIERSEFAQENDMEYLAVWGVSSIEPHEQNSDHASNFSQIARLTVDLWEQLAEQDKKKAIKISNMWKDNQALILMCRMYLHALANKNLYNTTAQAASALLHLSDGFWDHDKRKEIATLLQKRWQDFTKLSCKKLEKKIIKGPPRKKYQNDLTKEEWEEIREQEALKKFLAIKQGRGTLSDDAQNIFNTLNQKHSIPEWQIFFDSWSGPLKSELIGSPTGEHIHKDFQIREAFKNLQMNAKPHQRDTPAWREFLAYNSSEWKKLNHENKQDCQFGTEVLGEIIKIPKKDFEEVADSTAYWMNDILQILNKNQNEDQKFKLWHKILDVLERRANQNKEKREMKDAFTTSINCAEGKLVEMAMSWTESRKQNQGFPEKTKPLMERLVQLKNYQGLLTRTRMMQALDYFHFIAPKWTEENLISCLDKNSEERWALWNGYKYNRYFPRPELFNEMKKALLEAITASSAEMPSDKNNYLISYSSPEQEMKNRLTWLLVLVLFPNASMMNPMNLPKKK